MKKMSIGSQANIPIIDERGFLYYKFVCEPSGEKWSQEEAASFLQRITDACQGKSYPLLIDLQAVEPYITNEAGKLLAESPELNAVRVSQAILVNALSKRLLVNLYLRLNRPKCPSKVFLDEAEAIAWVKEFCSPFSPPNSPDPTSDTQSP